jgi:hypothetical protein
MHCVIGREVDTRTSLAAPENVSVYRTDSVYLDEYDLAAGRSRLAMRMIPFGWIAKQALDKAWFASDLGNLLPGPDDLDMLQS